MVIVRKIRPVVKGKYLMNKIVLSKNKKELTTWRKVNRRRFRQVFYGSPRKDKRGYYALISDV